MEAEEALADLPHNTDLMFEENQDHSKAIHPRISIPDIMEQEIEPKLPTDRKYSSEWLFLVQNGDSKASHSSNSSSDESKHSLPPDIDFLEDDILSFSTSRSIDKLRISEQHVPPAGPLEECIIPEMPCGSELVLTLLASWGDEHFIGLNGIEILDHLGKRPVVKNVSCWTTNLNWCNLSFQ